MPEKLGDAFLELGTDDRKLGRGLARAESLTLKTVDRLKTIPTALAIPVTLPLLPVPAFAAPIDPVRQPRR